MTELKNNNLFDFLPPKLRQQLFEEFNKVHDDYIFKRHQSTEHNAARFCETVYSIIKGYLDGGQYPTEAEKPTKIIDSCKQLENYPSIFPYSTRILIPRILVIIYDIRNKRNVGHISGDIDSNHMDATLSFKGACWVMAELIRVFYGIDMDGAERLVNQLSSSGNLPTVWDINGKKRVLNPDLSSFEKTLIILYDANSRLDKDLVNDVKYSNLSMYKKRVLDKGDDEELWDYNQKTGLVTISCIGIKKAEGIIRKNIAE